VDKLSTRVIGISIGTCAACGESAPLKLVETRRRRRLRRLLDRHFDDAALRTATCHHCFSTYPVRLNDVSPLAAGRRLSRYLHPAVQGGRDWTYPTAA
jgi:hypothetical protein